MITAEDFVLELNETEESKNFKLATVTTLFTNNTAKVQFDGEDTPSEKQYAYLASYTPKTLDRVLLAVTGGTYIILGKVNYNIAPPIEEELDRYLFDLKLVTMQKGLNVTGNTTLKNDLTVSGLATLNGGVSVTGNIGVNGAITGVSVSTTGNITASGNIAGSDITASGALKGSNAQINGPATVYDFHHRGSYLSFFNLFQNISKKSVAYLSGTPDISTIHNKVNELLQALKAYGLIG